MSESANILEQLSAYLDGELDASDARVVEAAVAADAEVARALERLRAARDLVRHLPREQAPDGFALRVMAQAERGALLVHAAPAPPRSGRRWLRVAQAASVLVALSAGLAVCVTVYKGLTPQNPARRVATDHAASQPAIVVHYGGQPYDSTASDMIRGEPLAMRAKDELAQTHSRGGLVTSGGDSLSGLDNGRREQEDSKASSEWPEEFEDLARAFPLQGWRDWLGTPAEPSDDAPRGPDPFVAVAGIAMDLPSATKAEITKADADVDANLAEATTITEEPARHDVAVLDPLGDALAMLISTDDVDRTRQQVEDIFTSNGVTLLSVQPLEAPALPPTMSQTAVNHMHYDRTLFQRARTGESPVDVVVVQAFVTPAQADAVAKELDELRRDQSTPQRSARETHERSKAYIAQARATEERQRNTRALASAYESRAQIQAPTGELVALNRPGNNANAQSQLRMNQAPPQKQQTASAATPSSRLAMQSAAKPTAPTGQATNQKPPAETPHATSAPQFTNGPLPIDARLQRVLVTVEFRQLPRTTTEPTNSH